MTPDFHVSIGLTQLDMTWVITTIRSSYWGERLSPIQIMRACDNSLCFGAYFNDSHLQAGRQIGFCRVVTDRATFSSITDLIVDEINRHRGVGTALMEAVVSHPWVSPTICVIQSRDAVGFYAKFGFESGTHNVLKRDPK
jgi:GNAT superfamily N-acetyltransferase